MKLIWDLWFWHILSYFSHFSVYYNKQNCWKSQNLLVPIFTKPAGSSEPFVTFYISVKNSQTLISCLVGMTSQILTLFDTIWLLRSFSKVAYPLSYTPSLDHLGKKILKENISKFQVYLSFEEYRELQKRKDMVLLFNENDSGEQSNDGSWKIAWFRWFLSIK